MKCWSDETWEMEQWNTGITKNGIMEYRSIGMLGFRSTSTLIAQMTQFRGVHGQDHRFACGIYAGCATGEVAGGSCAKREEPHFRFAGRYCLGFAAKAGTARVAACASAGRQGRMQCAGDKSQNYSHHCRLCQRHVRSCQRDR